LLEGVGVRRVRSRVLQLRTPRDPADALRVQGPEDDAAPLDRTLPVAARDAQVLMDAGPHPERRWRPLVYRHSESSPEYPLATWSSSTDSSTGLLWSSTCAP